MSLSDSGEPERGSDEEEEASASATAAVGQPEASAAPASPSPSNQDQNESGSEEEGSFETAGVAAESVAGHVSGTEELGEPSRPLTGPPHGYPQVDTTWIISEQSTTQQLSASDIPTAVRNETQPSTHCSAEARDDATAQSVAQPSTNDPTAAAPDDTPPPADVPTVSQPDAPTSGPSENAD